MKLSYHSMSFYKADIFSRRNKKEKSVDKKNYNMCLAGVHAIDVVLSKSMLTITPVCVEVITREILRSSMTNNMPSRVW